MSAKYESKGNHPGSVGHDKKGGYSYGTYQIATRTGTMDDFLRFVKSVDPHVAEQLHKAGGAAAAKRGDQKFKDAWKKLAQDKPTKFAELQHDFIGRTHYVPQASKLKTNFGIDLEKHSLALRNVIWSTAVQHRHHTQDVVREALGGREASKVSDKELIKAIYGERSKVDRYFRSSTKKEKAGLKERFASEEKDALKMLEGEKKVQQ